MTAKTLLARAVLLCATISLASRAAGAPVEWPVAQGGNGHFYEFVPAPDMTWDDARTAAQGRTVGGVAGHLATITSAGEWDFVVKKSGFSVVQWAAWLGGAQPQGSLTTSEGWFWITGEPFNYAPWGSYLTLFPEPNDVGGQIHGEDGSENYLSMVGRRFAVTQLGKPNLGTFNDEGSNILMDGYIVEYPVPEPAAIWLIAAVGGMALGRLHKVTPACG